MPLRAEEGHGKGVFMEEKDMESMGMRLLETGRRGAYISVKNDSSGRKVRARVIDENNVMVVQ